jgi:7,8-dihydropterin-6-yl-methyl-4-(beta-D-ribofuranosyl)aminobenzene 5'-phosphate synthase
MATTAEGKESANLELTVVFDNVEYDPGLGTSWGYGCFIDYRGARILFDTGGDGDILISNMAKLGLDPADVDVVVLSHVHGDHTGGLASVLNAGGTPVVYVLKSFPAAFKDEIRARTLVAEVSGPGEILPGVYTTGEMIGSVPEQALALETAEGLLVVTGCAHPGVHKMVQAALEVAAENVYLVMGGYHLGGASRAAVLGIVDDLTAMGVRKVAPSHCTGEDAIQIFADEYGENFVRSGAGYKLSLALPAPTD